MLHLSLAVYVSSADSDGPRGPLFHHWLPDGPADAVSFSFSSPDQQLRVWFERRGFTDNGFVQFASDRREVEESIMRRQGWLDAGPLLGEATFPYATAAELAAVREDRQGSDDYRAVARRVIEFLHPPLSRLLDMLRLQYGQYWLDDLQPWDSRTNSLGGYCQALGLKWRESPSEAWRRFLPDDPSYTYVVPPLPGRGYAEYLTQQDWASIRTALAGEVQHPLALRVLARAHELNAQGHRAEAFVQAVTALELALEHFVATRAVAFDKTSAPAVAAFSGLPLPQQLSLLALATLKIPPDVTKLAVRGIDVRNNIVHEAKFHSGLPPEELSALFSCVKTLLDLGEFKTPSLINGNGLGPP